MSQESGLIASIKARLLNLAKREHKSYEYIQIHYFIERMIHRISLSRYANDFIIKGGLLLYVILGNQARPTKDIDVLARQVPNDTERMAVILGEICLIDGRDGIIFDPSTIVADRIKENADYQGIHIKITGHLGNSRQTVEFDIGFGDVVIPKPHPMIYPSLLKMDETTIYAYSQESVIAEKFQAMVYLAQANSRMKDFFDIYNLASMFDFDGSILSEAIRETFRRRETSFDSELPVLFVDSFVKDSQKKSQWRSFIKHTENARSLSYESVINSIIVFLKPVFESIQHDRVFSMRWNHEKFAWE